MKCHIWIESAAVILLAVPSVAVRAAQDNAEPNSHQRHHHHRHYKLLEVSTFGGPGSYLNFPPSRVLTGRGTLVGFAETNVEETLVAPLCAPDICYILNSFTWRNGEKTQLPSLANGVSNVAVWGNDRGWVAGTSETGALNPNGFPATAPVLWRHGQVTNLGTLGGTTGDTFAVNNLGEAVGRSSNGVGGDQFSMLRFYGGAPNDTQSRAFLWKDGVMTNLGTLGGPDSIAVFNNDKGQIAGMSFPDNIVNPRGFLTVATFFWEKGEMKDIGNLGGHETQPIALNQRGELVGLSLTEGEQIYRSYIYRHGELKDMGDLGGANTYVHNINDYDVATGYSDIPAGTPVFGHPFIWKHGHMIDMGAPPTGFNCANGQSVNVRDQVVGFAGCSVDGSRGIPFFWEPGGSVVDLNTLVVPKTTFRIDYASSINDRGEIACAGTLPTGEDRACLLVPVDDDHEGDDDNAITAEVKHSSVSAAPYSPSLSGTAARQMVRDQMMKSSLKGSSRYHLPIQHNTPQK